MITSSYSKYIDSAFSIMTINPPTEFPKAEPSMPQMSTGFQQQPPLFQQNNAHNSGNFDIFGTSNQNNQVCHTFHQTVIPNRVSIIQQQQPVAQVLHPRQASNHSQVSRPKTAQGLKMSLKTMISGHSSPLKKMHGPWAKV